MDNLFISIALAGGLALFLYGMTLLGSGLEKISGGRMEKILEKLTSNIFSSVLLGLLVTAAVQSSSATTVIVVGLVNSGILKLRSAVGVIMGANIGTTVTGQILRFSGIDQGDQPFILQLLKPTTLAPLICIVGVIMFMVAKRSKYKDIGQILLGFGILFNGMFAMEAAVRPLQESDVFLKLFETMGAVPVLGVLTGALVTAIVQSSSASVGILQALSSTGAITCASAFPIIMGQNIGTTITPILASIGANKNAKRSAMVHVYFNIIGTIVFLAGVYTIQHFIGFSFWDAPIDKGGIANFHTLFNIIVTVLFIPFAGLLAKLAEWTIRDKKITDDAHEDIGVHILDDRFLMSPSLAITQSHKVVHKMGLLAGENLNDAMSLFTKHDLKLIERIREKENIIDKMEDRLNNYLLKISDCELTDTEGKNVTQLLHSLSEFERVGDYVINIVESAEQLHDNQTSLSGHGKDDISSVGLAVSEVLQMSINAFENNNADYASRIEPLEQTIDRMDSTLKSVHIERLKAGECTIEGGLVFLDILTNLERISDHCSNVAVYILGLKTPRDDDLNRHEYLKQMHAGGSDDYVKALDFYDKKYYSKINKR